MERQGTSPVSDLEAYREQHARVPILADHVELFLDLLEFEDYLERWEIDGHTKLSRQQSDHVSEWGRKSRRHRALMEAWATYLRSGRRGPRPSLSKIWDDDALGSA
jgi:hypothetical protein